MAGSETVFIVHDEAAIRESLKSLLEIAGFAVHCFRSAHAFLGKATADLAGCLLADVRLPDMDGAALQVQVARTCPGVSVILLTGDSDLPLAIQGLQAGAFDFIDKPIEQQVLLAAVRRAFRQASDTDPELSEPATQAEQLNTLSMRERQVLSGLVAGHPNKVIAHRLHISPRTVEIYRARLMDKMRASNLSELLQIAAHSGVSAD